jgi:phosphoenolpyruvate carboxykinase (ATP)
MATIGRTQMNYGRVNSTMKLEDQGITGLACVHYNLLEPSLMEVALKAGEGTLGQGGTFLVSTGKYTGRSPKDKFVVRTPEVVDKIWWENNPPMDPSNFDILYGDMLDHMKGGTYYVQDLFAGADPAHRLDVRLVTELAWHNLFIRHVLRRPKLAELDTFTPNWTIINCPSFKANPERHGCRTDTIVALNFAKKIILIGGTEYAGENKKSVFTLMNYMLPEKGIMPMHCSANHSLGDPEDSAVFFGLSGTGKTTLSTDPNRVLIGDDEHGWSDRGTFNFEGGCYAKTIDLTPESEPEIYATTLKFATVIENMVFDEETKELDYRDSSLTPNMRCAYPLDYISNASKTGLGGYPKNIIMLTCDAFGVLPPISRLTAAQATYHFLSGFTSKVAGTERGVTEPEPTFSTCFGAPFIPLRPEVYGKILQEKIVANGVNCWLINTGWTGGGYGTGSRMPIKATRTLLTAALNGSLLGSTFRKDPNFNFAVPVAVRGVDSNLLDPRSTWSDKAAYDLKAQKLVEMFTKNFVKYAPSVNEDVRDSLIS